MYFYDFFWNNRFVYTCQLEKSINFILSEMIFYKQKINYKKDRNTQILWNESNDSSNGLNFKVINICINRFSRFPLAPIFGGFPVKLRSFIGKPIPFDPTDTPETLKAKCLSELQDLINNHQRVPGSIVRALLERFSRKKHTSWKLV